MKSRLIVAAIGIPILYIIIFSGWKENLIFAAAVSAACTVAALELNKMFKAALPWVLVNVIPVALAPLLAWRLSETGIFLAGLTSIPLLLIFYGLSEERRAPMTSIMASMMPLIWLLPPAGLVVVLRQSEAGFDLVILLIAAVFLNDTGAYFTGRAFGRHKLSPRISPNKTVEGFLGGVLIGTFVMWYGHFIVETDAGTRVFSGWEGLAIGLTVALATPIGDLFESLIKRSAGVKDSGSILGEHGGALDRIDALLFAIPVMYVGCFYAGAL